MVEEKPKVFVSILSWNGCDDLLHCLENLFLSDYENFEVLVVDNGSTDQSVETVKSRYPHIKIIQNTTNLGFTGGNNVGMKYATDNGADYVFLLNDDAIVMGDTLSKLVSCSESDKTIGLASPIVYTVDGKIQFCGSLLDLNETKIHSKISYEHDGSSNKNGLIDCLWGTALLIKKELIQAIGLLDDRFFAYFEDTDYSVRSHASGFKNIIATEAKVIHKNTTLQAERPPHYHYLYIRNKYMFFMKYHEHGTFSYFRFIRLYVSEVLYLAGNLRDRDLQNCVDACLTGFWDAISGTSGPPGKNSSVPAWVKKIILWHPYFIANILK